MLRATTLTALLALVAASGFSASVAEAKGTRWKAGEAHERTTPGGVKYAVYLPKKWKRGKPFPLMILIPNQRSMPIDAMRLPLQFENF